MGLKQNLASPFFLRSCCPSEMKVDRLQEGSEGGSKNCQRKSGAMEPHVRRLDHKRTGVGEMKFTETFLLCLKSIVVIFLKLIHKKE